MSFMAETAAPASRNPVDMNKMKIALAIPESGQRRCPFFRHKGRLMAPKAEIVSGLLEGSIRFLGIFVL